MPIFAQELKTNKTMKYADAFEIIRKSNTNKFNVKIGSVTYKKRFFISDDKFCEYVKNSRKYGRYMSEYEVEEWDSITPCTQVKDVVKVRNYMSKVVKYLTASGLWANIREDYEIILSLPDDVLDDIIHSSWTDQRDKLHKIAVDLGRDNLSFHCDGIIYTAKKGIKNVNYNTHTKLNDIAVVEFGIKQGILYNRRWHKGYDNSVEVKTNGNIVCGWYSEEYKGCGNGHYYLLLDARHAHFYEDD